MVQTGKLKPKMVPVWEPFLHRMDVPSKAAWCQMLGASHTAVIPARSPAFWEEADDKQESQQRIADGGEVLQRCSGEGDP